MEAGKEDIRSQNEREHPRSESICYLAVIVLHASSALLSGFDSLVDNGNDANNNDVKISKGGACECARQDPIGM